MNLIQNVHDNVSRGHFGGEIDIKMSLIRVLVDILAGNRLKMSLIRVFADISAVKSIQNVSDPVDFVDILAVKSKQNVSDPCSRLDISRLESAQNVHDSVSRGHFGQRNRLKMSLIRVLVDNSR